MKYSDFFLDTLSELGYTHCFFLSGGNILHLLESASTRFKCIAVINEVSAVIAADYFNVASRSKKQKAFVLVTAGPGVTNAITGVVGAWLDNREVLIVAGQARSNMLAREGLKQLGHQEIGGTALLESVTKFSRTIDEPVGFHTITEIVELSKSDPKGPVFVEICLDISAIEVTLDELIELQISKPKVVLQSDDWSDELGNAIRLSDRPLILLGSGVSFDDFSVLLPNLEKLNIPIATSWNASDYLDFDADIFAGRPGAYGMRWSNIVTQQADLILVVGTRFSFWETGFNWSEFAPLAKIWSFNIDASELNKPGPTLDRKVISDLKVDFPKIIHQFELNSSLKWGDWIDHIKVVKDALPLSEESNNQFPSHCNPFEIIKKISGYLNERDLVIPCSSGGAYTTVMQGFPQKRGQLLTNNRGLASMGYGLAGAMGTCFANPESRVISVEGDGGFLQNLSEISTVVHHNLNLKIFIFINNGYASIKLSQKGNFDGHYVGCDPETGVAIPDLKRILLGFDLPVYEIRSASDQEALTSILDEPGPAIGLVHIHPDQTYFPKIVSRMSTTGVIESNPIHLMYPDLPPGIFEPVSKFLKSDAKMDDND